MDRRIEEAALRERSRLGRFIRRRVADPSDAEDILQDVFAQLLEANRLLMPIEHVTGWLFQVARNRIVDLFRRPHEESASDFEDLLPSSGGGPDERYLRSLVLEELEHALADLPAEQRDAFVAHEIDGESFKDMSKRTGVAVNTLLSRKHTAVLFLRERLQELYDELKKA
ncbi:MAG TPA: sigma-70 family RNA polymerase sigma factor [Candidatus Polarisedimenticolaceae bacterium]|nr:sigma-70 family RNA polymerase sigma factor [Candidatus Polarisedimenticolaceae bacterium]